MNTEIPHPGISVFISVRFLMGLRQNFARRLSEMPREEWTLEEKVEVLEKRIAALERILRISQILTSTLQLEPLLQTITQAATELTETEASSIMLVDKNTGELRFEAVSGAKREEVKRVTVPLEGSIAGWIVRQGKPLIIPNAREDPRFY